jgi:hypothetical protein
VKYELGFYISEGGILLLFPVNETDCIIPTCRPLSTDEAFIIISEELKWKGVTSVGVLEEVSNLEPTDHKSGAPCSSLDVVWSDGLTTLIVPQLRRVPPGF